MRFGSRGPSKFFLDTSRIRHRNALTEKAWEDAIQGRGKHPTWRERERECSVLKSLHVYKQHKALSLKTLAGWKFLHLIWLGRQFSIDSSCMDYWLTYWSNLLKWWDQEQSTASLRCSWNAKPNISNNNKIDACSKFKTFHTLLKLFALYKTYRMILLQ